MALRTPVLKSPPFLLADWVEFRTLADPRGFFRINRLKRYWDIHRESEDSDPAGQRKVEEDTDIQGASGEDGDAFFASISDELSDRSTDIGEAYPFEFDGERFKIKDQLSESAYIYIFCLLLTHPKSDEILDGSWLPNINHIVRDLFQACSTVAASGYIVGSAFSFGWPRPDNNMAFLPALQHIYGIFGEGEIVKSVPAGASPFTKDEEIDVIAWKPKSSAGTHYMLGQVASGDNWEAKSILGGSINYFHEVWFAKKPPSQSIASIFIPHILEDKFEGTRKERMAQLVTKYGIIFDRIHLPQYAHEGITLADTPGNTFQIQRRADIPQIVAWVQAQTHSLQASNPVLL